MRSKLNRRNFLAGLAAAGLPTLPSPAVAQQKPIKIGLMTVKTGGLATGGIHLEEGITCFLKDKSFTLAGRRIELIVADTAGVPATAKTKAVELVERDNVDLIMGPLAAFEWLAIEDYLGEHKMPTLGFGGAEDLTQRRRNGYQVRTSNSSAQCLYPLADYARNEMKLRTAITAADDFAFGYEQVGGFQTVFEDGGGRVIKKLWSPFNTPDYLPYLAQIDAKEADVVVLGYAGANPIKFIKQFRDQGFTLPLLGGSTVVDDSIMRNFGDEAIGVINSIGYTLDLDTDANRRFIAAMKKYYGADVPIGFYAAALYVNGQILEAALTATAGDTDPDKLIAAVKQVSLTDTPRGPVKFDDYGNLTFTVYVRKVEKKGAKLVNTTIKSYPDVSQFWHYDPNKFLAQPVFSRDFPPLKDRR
ncbi:MAG TPA: ABC transporter substrate-binding protein [Xanthobacteraceae bacterium]|jgi:branched-chain amino acid transport system substrate-binding protein|nr:ABC transporter substrate-binding protein [Xanthobacteraceae bacterium]